MFVPGDQFTDKILTEPLLIVIRSFTFVSYFYINSNKFIVYDHVIANLKAESSREQTSVIRNPLMNTQTSGFHYY